MPHPPALKASLKRGAFVAAANWPLIAVQFIAEGTEQLLLAVPVVGGIALVVLLLGADIEEVMAGDMKESIPNVIGALRANPVALGFFGASFLVVLLGASVLTFIVKGGTVAVLAAAEAQAGPIERPPLRLAALRRANITNIEPFLEGCRKFWRRYVKLGFCLLIVYAATGAVCLAFVVGGYGLHGNVAVLLGWTFAAVPALGALVVWITLVNFLYLLTQMAIAVEDVGVRDGMRRVAQFIRAQPSRGRGNLWSGAAARRDHDARLGPGHRRARPDRCHSVRRPGHGAAAARRVAAARRRVRIPRADRARRLSHSIPVLSA